MHINTNIGQKKTGLRLCLVTKVVLNEFKLGEIVSDSLLEVTGMILDIQLKQLNTLIML